MKHRASVILVLVVVGLLAFLVWNTQSLKDKASDIVRMPAGEKKSEATPPAAQVSIDERDNLDDAFEDLDLLK